MSAQTLLAVSSLMQAAGSIEKGVAGFEAGRYNARAAREEAELAETTARMEAERIRERGRRVMAAQRVGAAASGLDPTSGSPLRILLDSLTRSEQDAMLARWAGQVRAAGLRAEAGYRSRQGRRSLISGALGAGTTLTSYLVNKQLLERYGPYSPLPGEAGG